MSLLEDLKAVTAKISADLDALAALPASDPTAVPAADLASVVSDLQAIDGRITAMLPPAA